MGAVGLVLLITSSNVAGLLLARGSARRGEMSIRAALGATGFRLVRQLMTESLVLALVAGSLGTLLAIWLRDLCAEYVIAQWITTELPGTGEAGLSVSALLFALLVSLVTGLLFGIVPALRAARGDVIDGLRAGVTTTDAAGTRFRSGLVVGQVAISMILLIGAGLLMRSLTRLMAVDPGFDTRNLLSAQIDLPEADYSEREKRIQVYHTLRENLLAISGVENVALANMLPFRNVSGTTYVYPAGSPPIDLGDAPSAYDRTVFPGYFKAMGIPLLAGRGLEMTDRSGSPPVTVVSEELAQRHFPNENPIGRKIVVDLGQPVTVEIVGVVGDVHEESLRVDWSDAFYISYLHRPHYTMRLAVRTAVEPGSVAAALRDAVWSLDRNLPVADVATMDTLLWRSLARSRVTAFALTLLAIVALMLATTGLYAVLAYYVVRRRREIAIRIALGADAEKVVGLVLKRGLLLTAVGVIVGLAGAVGLTRLIEELLYGVEPTDAMTFGLVGLLFTLVARALRIDPISVLRAE
jgi:predicted permease